MSVAALTSSLPPFKNESYADFAQPGHAGEMRKALADVRSQFGKEYELIIAGDRRHRADKLISVNPANPKEVVGVHQKGTEQDARDAVEKAYEYFPHWSDTAAEWRADLLVRLADVIR